MSDSRKQILVCARDIFLDEGMSHFSMRKVAACAGVSATALYRHFASIFAKYLRRVDENQPALQVLHETCNSYLDSALREQAYYEMMFMTSEQMTGLKQLSKNGAGELKNSFDILQQRVERCISNGAITAEDSYRTAFAIWAFAHGQISLYIDGRSGLSKKEFIEGTAII